MGLVRPGLRLGCRRAVLLGTPRRHHQLVDAGQVLRDLLAAGTPIPHVRLTQVFRQASRSGVVTNAHRINAGSHPQVRGLDDFFLFGTDDAEEAARLTADVTVELDAELEIAPLPQIFRMFFWYAEQAKETNGPFSQKGEALKQMRDVERNMRLMQAGVKNSW